jgi:hypothetical protein
MAVSPVASSHTYPPRLARILPLVARVGEHTRSAAWAGMREDPVLTRCYMLTAKLRFGNAHRPPDGEYDTTRWAGSAGILEQRSSADDQAVVCHAIKQIGCVF